jgi:hypothetical protein
MLIWAPELWPEVAESWYAQYERQFWQGGTWLAGFREYPHDIDVGWFNMADVDAGPIIGGYGVAASAFGVGAARVMGRSDQAYKLAAQALAASWPLPNGTLLVPRILSNVSDAPYLGEAATLFALTRRTLTSVPGRQHAKPPAIVYVGMAVFLLLAAVEIAASLQRLRRWRRSGTRRYVPLPRIQVIAWGILLLSAILAWALFGVLSGLVFLLAALTLPWQRTRSAARREMPEAP